jgi:plastocyanin domain-containing protein
MKKIITIVILTLVTILISGCGNLITGNAVATNEPYQEIKMQVTRSGYSPDKFVIEKGVPVKWIIDGKELTGCNNAIQVPDLNLEFEIKEGLQTIEFTPTKEGVVSWSCWMGMIPGVFIVKDNIDLSNDAQVQKELDAIPNPRSSGGCGCGG